MQFEALILRQPVNGSGVLKTKVTINSMISERAAVLDHTKNLRNTVRLSDVFEYRTKGLPVNKKTLQNIAANAPKPMIPLNFIASYLLDGFKDLVDAIIL